MSVAGSPRDHPEPRRDAEEVVWQLARARLQEVKAPESLRARISAMLAVERSLEP